MFPTQHHAQLAFAAFDIHHTNSLSPSQLRHALVAVGLGDAPKQIVYGIIRQSRSEGSHNDDDISAVHSTGSSASTPNVGNEPQYPASATFLKASHASGGALLLSHYASQSAAAFSAATGTAPPQEYETKPITAVTLSEFLIVVKELAPSAGSSEELSKGFKCMDTRQQGRITLDTMVEVAHREEQKLVGKLCLLPQYEALLRKSPFQSQSPSVGRSSNSSPTQLPSMWSVSDDRRSPRSGAKKEGPPTYLASDESCLRRVVERVAEYREKGISFDEWRVAFGH
ncbi:Hypothetical protein, putative [Bodo saltans]|uniref:EF-hand domain-containing protein n=1 Tax=Bodo saltans TaxID=75058 RepID=A0A0S4II03_BODSA|nr:Hypothetical protein, putative [Bodo saltans]|eukprot:CUE70270.1 Hypothetical protein, putative [Bodo saltans]